VQPRRAPTPLIRSRCAEAAKLLEREPPDVRRRDDLGKFPLRGHAINASRIYVRDDVPRQRKKVVEGERPAEEPRLAKPGPLQVSFA
jgi:hypothetical protein